MRKARPETVREFVASRAAAGKPLKRLPQRRTTKHMHQRLLRALGGDRRFRRA